MFGPDPGWAEDPIRMPSQEHLLYLPKIKKEVVIKKGSQTKSCMKSRLYQSYTLVSMD